MWMLEITKYSGKQLRKEDSDPGGKISTKEEKCPGSGQMTSISRDSMLLPDAMNFKGIALFASSEVMGWSKRKSQLYIEDSKEDELRASGSAKNR